MHRSYLQRTIALVAFSLLATLLVPIASASAVGDQAPPSDRTYLITIENLTDGQPFTPPVLAAHKGRNRVWQPGHPASPGIQAVAENGDVPALVAEVAANPAVGAHAVGTDAPIMPGEAATFEFTAPKNHRRLSTASMLICTNDGFTGVNSLKLPRRGGVPTEVYLNAYDAGTEKNTENFADLVPPCGTLTGVDSRGQGTGASNPALAEHGVITSHPGIGGSGDLVPAIHDWDDPIAKLTITRIDNAALYEVEIHNGTAGQPFTPPVVATHRKPFDLFEPWTPATPGIQGLAENGDVPGLIAELDGTRGVVTIAAADGPVLTGDSTTVRFYTRRGVRRFSFASMLICTNDGFVGLNRQLLPKYAGHTKTYGANTYDAGTEKNTEKFADLVPPCGPLTGVDSGGQGTGASNPALAEHGVITSHPGIYGWGNLIPAIHDWDDPAAKVTVTRLQ